MSMVVYGIVEADRTAVTGSGFEDRPLRGVAEGPLMAIVSDHEGLDLEPSLEVLLEYEQVIQRLMDGGAVLPAQFASVLASEADVRNMLRRRRRDLLARLVRVRGAVELALRAQWHHAAEDRAHEPVQSGTAYLRDRLELRQSARRVASELDPLTALARSCHRALVPKPDLPVLDAYLVDRSRVNEFVALVEQLDESLEEVDLVCTGPWPPYSFADGAYSFADGAPV